MDKYLKEDVEIARLKERREQYLDDVGLRTDREKIGNGLSVERFLDLLDDQRLDSGTRAALDAADAEVRCDSYARSLERAFRLPGEVIDLKGTADSYLREAQYAAARKWNSRLNTDSIEDYIYPESEGFKKYKE